MRVRALTRKSNADLPAGVEVVRGDLNAPESLAPAPDGVTAMHLLTLTGEDNAPLATGPAIVALATAAGVRRVTLLGTGEGPVEQAVAASDLEWTVLWPIDMTAETVEDVTGRPPRRFADWAADHASAFERPPSARP